MWKLWHGNRSTVDDGWRMYLLFDRKFHYHYHRRLLDAGSYSFCPDLQLRNVALLCIHTVILHWLILTKFVRSCFKHWHWKTLQVFTTSGREFHYFSTLTAKLLFLMSSRASWVHNFNDWPLVLVSVESRSIPLCPGYMWNKIISKLFKPSSASVWNNFVSARGNLSKIISKLFHRLTGAHEYFPTCSLSLK